MTDSSRIEPWKTLIAYAEAGEGDELEAFVLSRSMAASVWMKSSL